MITDVRKNSTADEACFQKEDVIQKINKGDAYTYNLQQINDLLKTNEGKTIDFEIDRKGKTLHLSIALKNIL